MEDVVMTAVANDLQVTTAKFNIDTISYQGVPAVNCYCRTISCGYSHSFYHTEWLHSTGTSQHQRSPQGGGASPGSWDQL